jgi:enoyl-CoA hydratase
MSSEPPVRYELSGSTAWITVDRAAALNALDRATVRGLAEAVERAAGDAAVRAVVLTGTGDRAFIAGADIQELQARTLVAESRPDGGGRRALAARFEGLDKPTIAAINSFALGGGLELAMACTLRVASERARLGLPEIKLGIIPGNGGTQRLARFVGWGRAMEMVLTGEPIDAPTALAWGLVNRVVAHERLGAEAQGLADTLAQRPPLALRAAKEAVLASRDLGVEAGGHLERVLFAMCCGTADKAEGGEAVGHDDREGRG